MLNLKTKLMALLASCLLFASAEAAPQQNVGVVRFKSCVEESKVGRREHDAFEQMKKEMGKKIETKEKEFQEIAAKLQDSDYMDTLKPEVEAELKHKFRQLSQELNAFQNRYYQELQQSNFRILQTMSQYVSEASKKVASDMKLDLIVNDDNCFFFNQTLDVTQKVIAIMDKSFEEQQKGAKS